MKRKFLALLILLSLLLGGCANQASQPATSTQGSVESTTPPAPTAPDATATLPSSTSSASEPKLGEALNLVMGSDSEPSVFPSYHIEITLDAPSLSDDQTSIVNQTTQISADVAGSNVHILQIDPGTTAQKEGYILGDKEYKMVDGKPEEQNGEIALSWAMMQLKIVGVYAYPVYFAQKAGTDTIDGQAADVYSFDSSNANAESNSAMSSLGAGDLTTGAGKVWIDPKTGGMLKLDMTYTSTLTDNNQKEIGKGNGSIKLEVSKVGQVTVTSPVQ